MGSSWCIFSFMDSHIHWFIENFNTFVGKTCNHCLNMHVTAHTLLGYTCIVFVTVQNLKNVTCPPGSQASRKQVILLCIVIHGKQCFGVNFTLDVTNFIHMKEIIFLLVWGSITVKQTSVANKAEKLLWDGKIYQASSLGINCSVQDSNFVFLVLFFFPII